MSSIHFIAALGYIFDVNEKLDAYFDIFTVYKIDRLQIYKKNVLIFYIYICIYLLQRFLNLFVLKLKSVKFFIAVNAKTDIELTRIDLSF